LLEFTVYLLCALFAILYVFGQGGGQPALLDWGLYWQAAIAYGK